MLDAEKAILFLFLVIVVATLVMNVYKAIDRCIRPGDSEDQ